MSKQKPFMLSSEKVNSKRLLIKTDGIILTDFLENPVMFKEHSYTMDNIIGNWLNARVENGVLLAEPNIDTDTIEGKEISRRVEKGFLKGASIGGQVLEGYADTGEDGLPIYVVTKFHLKEASIVAIPSNKSCLRLYDQENELLENWTFADLPVQQTKPNTKMDLKGIAKSLGLSDTATEPEILAAIEANNARVVQFADFQKKQKEGEQADIIRLFDQAVADNKIGADQKQRYIKLGELDYQTTKETIENFPKPVSLTSIARGAGVATAGVAANVTFSDMSKSNPKALEKLHRENPTEFERLYQAEYGIALADDAARTMSENPNK